MTGIYAGTIAGIGGLLIILIFGYVVAQRSPRMEASEAVPKVYKIRSYYFYLLMITSVVFLALTLPHAPYPQITPLEADMSVTVIGRTWSWQMQNGPFTADRLRHNISDEIIVPLGQTVEFQVTSLDVNHGFGIYAPSGKIITQVQAMPGSINKLLHKFDKAGTYHILCMELCGDGHHIMQTKFRVE